MRPRLPHLLPIAAALLVPGALLAQSGSGRGGPGRGGDGTSGAGRPISALEAQHERRDAMRERLAERRGPERDALRERRRDREAALAPDDRAALAAALRARDARAGRTPEQAAFAQQLREQRRSLREAVAAGTLDRHAAAEQLRAWIAAHRPNAPTSP
jgi:Spy/CpxP family protein refolding chaperone